VTILYCGVLYGYIIIILVYRLPRQSRKKTSFLKEKAFRFLVFLGFNVRMTGHKIMTKIFTKNISYMNYDTPLPLPRSHVQTVAYKHNQRDWKATIFFAMNVSLKCVF